ncbi:MAG: hypothetical protein AAGI38_16795, partial [Bacteroidota bacterium]
TFPSMKSIQKSTPNNASSRTSIAAPAVWGGQRACFSANNWAGTVNQSCFFLSSQQQYRISSISTTYDNFFSILVINTLYIVCVG